MSASPMSAAQRAELLAAMDKPMTDEEAVQLITQLVLLASELAKVAAHRERMEMAILALRAGNMLPYVAERLLPAEGGAA